MSSLKDSIAPLESDLKAVPPRINVYHDLPFAIMQYDPADEWELRREIKLLATRLEAVSKDVHVIPMSELLWSALEQVHHKDCDEGLDVGGNSRRQYEWSSIEKQLLIKGLIK